jgi:two-component system, chemotaxis family, sensor kinase CheA
MDMNQYLDIFVEESREHLQSLNTCLLELERDPGAKSMLTEIFRVAHTLKGMSGTMGFSRMQKLTHVMEDVLDALRNNRLTPNASIVDVLFQCLDALENYTNQIVASGNEGTEDYADIVTSLSSILSGKPDAEPPASGPKAGAVTARTELSSPSDVNATGLLALNQYDVNVLGKALGSGMNVLQIRVELSTGCLLKAARAFIVFQILERSAEILKAQPRVEDIEDEKFDNHFTVLVVTPQTKAFFEKEINSVAEVSRVVVTALQPAELVVSESSGESQPLEQVLQDMADSADMAAEQSESSSQKTGPVLQGDASKSKTPKTGKTVRVDIDRLDVLMNLVSELIIVKTRLDDVKGNDVLGESVEYLERITTSLHDAVMKVRMVPVETVFNRFPRMIRDVARDLDKDVELHMSGEETELDRTVIDEIGDPLIHILRNSADHGLENRESRKTTGKPVVGNIWLRAYQDGNNVVIEVEDDGRGVDVRKVRQKIVERGLETREMANSLSDKEVISFLFKSGFSTADKVSDLSGRGVGLDVVKTKIEALGGIVELETELGKGSKTIIRLPLTLAIIQALLVRIGEEKYAIPLGSIREIDNVAPSDIQMVRNQEVIMLRNTVIPIVRLDKVLGVRGAVADSAKKQLTVVIVRKGEKLSGFVVDSLIGQQEIVIKSLGKLLVGVRWIAGATILGDGNVALIVDVNSLAL